VAPQRRVGGSLGFTATAARAAFTSSPSPASTAMTLLTARPGCLRAPRSSQRALVGGLDLLVALSVSISAITSPDFTWSPSFFSHLERLPFSMVGDSAGIKC